jgi:hypothetical protein
MYTDRVRALANDIVGKADYVLIHEENTLAVASSVTLDLALKDEDTYDTLPAKPLDEKAFFYSLIANSVNYCYWYGWHTIRPNGSSSSAMHGLLKQSFHDAWPNASRVIDKFYLKMADAGFPMMEERYRHLQDIKQNLSTAYAAFARMKPEVNATLEHLMEFPSYANDPFLKRAQLFCAMIQREVPYFNDIEKLTIPADYQIPKMLRHFGCLKYATPLALKVDTGVPILKGSAEEVSIRAASIVCCDRIAEDAGVPAAVVDKYLFSQREESSAAFHLTVTTDY